MAEVNGMKITVLGAGAGGTAVAFDCASHGHEVRLFDFEQFPENIAAIHEAGGIRAEGDIEGFGSISYAGHDLDTALQDARLIYVVGPAYSTEPFGKAVAGRLSEGQTVVVTPGSCGGALAFKRAAGLDVADDSIRVAETSTLHYAVRLTSPGHIRVFLKLKAGNLLAALPGNHTQEVLDLIADVYPSMEPAKSIMQTSLQNANPIIHPSVSLCNAARIELTGGDFLFYEEGVGDGVGRLIEALDNERIEIGRKLGVEILSDPELGMRQGYMHANNYGEGYRKAPGFLGIGAQPQLDHRYLHEDVGYGLVFMSALGRQVGVGTPSIDAVIRIASVVMARDYNGEALRTPDTLGISGMSTGELGTL
ncbi:MAG TPA: NAD/NADP octopine/nopaline dehydrogenase family protein [Xanthomonadales bacterium]|nr:NAD/NADP octopine/nopaline dehydrogenase family protein [Xanthomonadales bacterium]